MKTPKKLLNDKKECHCTTHCLYPIDGHYFDQEELLDDGVKCKVKTKGEDVK